MNKSTDCLNTYIYQRGVICKHEILTLLIWNLSCVPFSPTSHFFFLLPYSPAMLQIKSGILEVKLSIWIIRTLYIFTHKPLQSQTICHNDLYHTRHSGDFNGTFIDMCSAVYILHIVAVLVGTAILPCCLFDMQRSAVEQLHGLR